MQYPEHRIVPIPAEINFAIQRINRTEPQRDAAIITRKLLRLPQELANLNESDGLSVKINHLLLVAQLNRMTVIRGILERIEKLETDHMQVFQFRNGPFRHHVVRKASHAENQTIAVQGLMIFMLDFNRNAIARNFATFICQQQIRFNTAMPQFTRNVWVHEFRIFDTVRTDQVQSRVNQVRCQRKIFLARKNFLDTAVIIKVDIPIFVLFNISINVASLFLNIPEFLEKQCKFFSCHFKSSYNGKESFPYHYSNTLLTPIWTKIFSKIA